MDNPNEFFGEFISASSTPLQQVSSTPLQPVITLNQLSQNTNPYRDIIDNNTIYKKLIELENEIKNLKIMINKSYYQPSLTIPPQLQTPVQISAFLPSQNPYKTTNSNLNHI